MSFIYGRVSCTGNRTPADRAPTAGYQ